jgi:hypothetical protein
MYDESSVETRRIGKYSAAQTNKNTSARKASRAVKLTLHNRNKLKQLFLYMCLVAKVRG